MKRAIAILLVLVMAFSLAGCDNGTSDGKYKIGICQFAAFDALDQATKGFKDAVIEALGAENVEFVERNATGETSNCTSIINTLISSRVDLIMANATPAVLAAANTTKNIPILGTSVTEYGSAFGIENFTGTLGTNVSGTSDLADLEQQANMILEWVPNAKNVGMIYCKTESNSQYQVDQVKKYLEAKGVTCKFFSFNDTNDMSSVVREAADWSDAIYVPTDNTVANNAGVIDGICRSMKVPVFAGEEGVCNGCGVATLSISYYELGYVTGQMAVQVLRGEADIKTMPIKTAPNVTKKYDAQRCEDLGLTPVEGYEPIK